jgi:transketolase
LAAEFKRRMRGELPADWTRSPPHKRWPRSPPRPRTSPPARLRRTPSSAFAPQLPELIGGSADLAGSNLTLWKGSKGVSRNPEGGNYLYYGVREFGMTAIANGLALHGGLIPYTATFLVFSDYARNAIRMAALMKLRQIMVYTHDSIGLGEDGPTHQPVEHVASLRLIPNVDVWRPADASETAVAWAAPSSAPTARRFSRSRARTCRRSPPACRPHIRRGAYVLADCAEPAGRADRHRLGSQAGARRTPGAGRRRHRRARGLDALRRRLRPPGRRVPGSVLPRGYRAWPSRPASAVSGASMSDSTAPSSASIALASRHPAGELFDFFGFTVANVVATVKAVI